MVECLCWSTRLLPWRSCYTRWIGGVLRTMSGLSSGRSCPSSYRGTILKVYSLPWSRPSGKPPVGCSQCRSVCYHDMYQILWILGTNNLYIIQSYSSVFNSFNLISNFKFGLNICSNYFTGKTSFTFLAKCMYRLCLYYPVWLELICPLYILYSFSYDLIWYLLGFELAVEEHHSDCVSPRPAVVLCVLTDALWRRRRGAGRGGGGQRQGEEEEGGPQKGPWGTERACWQLR